MRNASHCDKRKSHEETKETSNTGNLQNDHHYYLDKRIIIITIWIKNYHHHYLDKNIIIITIWIEKLSSSLSGPKNIIITI